MFVVRYGKKLKAKGPQDVGLVLKYRLDTLNTGWI